MTKGGYSRPGATERTGPNNTIWRMLLIVGLSAFFGLLVIVSSMTGDGSIPSSLASGISPSHGKADNVRNGQDTVTVVQELTLVHVSTQTQVITQSPVTHTVTELATQVEVVEWKEGFDDLAFEVYNPTTGHFSNELYLDDIILEENGREFVALVYFSEAFVQMLRVAVCNAHKSGLTKQIFVGSERGACMALFRGWSTFQEYGNVKCIVPSKNLVTLGGEVANWNLVAGSNYAKVLEFKVQSIIDVMTWKYSNGKRPDLYMYDADVIHVRNGAVKNMLQSFPRADLIVQDDSRPREPETKDWINFGLFYARNTDQMVNFFERVLSEMRDRGVPDQDAAQMLLRGNFQMGEDKSEKPLPKDVPLDIPWETADPNEYSNTWYVWYHREKGNEGYHPFTCHINGMTLPLKMEQLHQLSRKHCLINLTGD
eukprot:Clim_evm73s150 gene=Clim_evmTU73s150